MKILSLTHNPARLASPYPYNCVVLIDGREWAFGADTIGKIKEKILERDKFSSMQDIEIDLTLNYPDLAYIP